MSPSHTLTDNQEIMERMYDMLESKEWWFVIDSNLLGSEINDKMMKIEKKYYPPKTKLNADFELVNCLPSGVIYIFKKQRITKKQLAKECGVEMGNNKLDIITPRPPNYSLGLTKLELHFNDSMNAIRQARKLR